MNKASGHDHIFYLWNSNESRNRIIEKYFTYTGAPQGLMSSEDMNLPKVTVVSYLEILKNKNSAIEQEFEMINQIHNKNNSTFPTKLAGTDCTQWFKHGMIQQFLSLEQKIDKFFMEKNISCICAYNINEIPDLKILKNLLKSHQLVMLDKPHSLFRRQT